MKIVVYQDRNPYEKRIQETLSVVYASLKQNYPIFEVIYVEYKNFELIKCDYAIIWNVYCRFKDDTMYRKKIKEFQEKNNNKLLVVELGFIKRDKYSSFGFDHISNFGNYPEFPNDTNRLDKLKIDVKELVYNNSSDKYILFCTQVPWDTQVQDIDYSKWIIDSINTLRKYTNRRIIVRNHPKHQARNGFELYDKNFFSKNNIMVEFLNNTLENDFENSYCVIAYNSTVLLDAILYGRPVLSGSNTSIISNLTIKDFSTIENLTKFSKDDVTKCLSEVAYKQWSLSDFAKGNPFKYFF